MADPLPPPQPTIQATRTSTAPLATAPTPPAFPETFLRARSEGWFEALGCRLGTGQWVFSDKALERLVSEDVRSDRFQDPNEEEAEAIDPLWSTPRSAAGQTQAL